VIQTLQEQRWDQRRYTFAGRLQSLRERAHAFPWLEEAVGWLIENRPPEPGRLSICHGDFHPLNLLAQEGRITGVLDWGGFMVADPAVDVATTIVLTTISAKHLLSVAEWQAAAELYLDAYRARRALDLTHLGYYRVRRCVIALLDGASGQAVWQHPGIVQDLTAYIRQMTGIRVQT
jgi:aminoglycoside phosphotransferase (APT) family kinase protein